MVKHGGSQLNQLKSALNSAGLSRTSDPKSSKKRKRGGIEGNGVDVKEKKAARLQQITTKLNPFERKVTKLKRDIPGEKVKGVTGRPGLSRQMGLEQRKKTLLVEYKQRGRTGGVVDRRFGENNPNMTPEERMLGRFTHERQKSATKVSFNLEEEDELTHYGQTLNETDDFEGTGFALENDAEEAEDKHFGGFSDDEEDEEEDGPPRKKSKAEVMSEIMEKSKAAKHERQAQKENDDNLRHQLDQELGHIRSLLFNLPEVDLSIPVRPKEFPKEEPAPISKPLPPADTDYDRLVRELGFEKRAKPTDRLKTEEEQALEEKEKLEKAEKARLRRMNGEGDSDGDDEDNARERRKRKRVPQADDLEDDFEPEVEEEFLGAGLDDTVAAPLSDEDEFAGASEDDESASSEDDDDENSESESEESLGGDLPESDSEESVSGDEEHLVAPKPAPNGEAKGKVPAKKELPFTFECPETHDDFLDIVADIDDEDVATVVQRIRALYHPSLGVGNKAKLEVLTTILIEHMLYAASSSSNPFPVITSLSPHIYSLTKSYAVTSAKTFVSKLIIMQKNLQRGLSQGPTSLESKTLPGIPELVLLRMIGAIWSTSDLWHPIVAPAMLLMGQYLGQCRVRSLKDLASGTFLCTLFLQYQSLSKRLVPETINFLLNGVLHLAPHDFKFSELPGSFPSPDFESEVLRSLKVTSKQLEPEPPNLLDLLKRDLKAKAVEQSKVDLLGLIITLIGRFAELYGSSDGFIDLFDPALAILSKLNTADFSPTLAKTLSTVIDSLSRRLKFARQRRQPLRLQDHKPIAISTIAPRFDPNFSGRKYTDEGPAAESNKLKSQYKKEKKEAMRELRKDNKFLATEKAQVQAKKDREYNEKMARTVGTISSERAEQKKAERMKSIAKLRAGKKK